VYEQINKEFWLSIFFNPGAKIFNISIDYIINYYSKKRFIHNSLSKEGAYGKFSIGYPKCKNTENMAGNIPITDVSFDTPDSMKTSSVADFNNKAIY
jgi:hypothetical protein